MKLGNRPRQQRLPQEKRPCSPPRQLPHKPLLPPCRTTAGPPARLRARPWPRLLFVLALHSLREKTIHYVHPPARAPHLLLVLALPLGLLLLLLVLLLGPPLLLLYLFGPPGQGRAGQGRAGERVSNGAWQPF